MPVIHIAVMVGSLRHESLNLKLAHAVALLAPFDFKFTHVKIDDLPLYNQDDDVHQSASVLRMKAQIQEAQGLLFVTPEYNRSITGVLKNAIDHASRPYGQSVWGGKPEAFIHAKEGFFDAQEHIGEGSLAFMQGWMDHYALWVRKHLA